MAVNYVKFFRGTPIAFANLVEKNRDTLYFISETDEAKGSLYLGSKLISGNVSSIADLEDILVDDLISNNQILAYDDKKEKWVNKSALDIIGLMIGATETAQGGIGLVPAPGEGQNNAFLRGDGVWAVPDSTIQLKTDNKSLSTLLDGQTISLKNFGIQYYKYIAATGSVETNDFVAAHYELQIVDANNPWKVNLEPKVVEENGELVLGWFEPNPTTIEGVQDEIIELNNQLDNLEGSVTNLENLLNNNYYTKNETQQYVAAEIAKVNHLTRKTFNSIQEAETFINSISNPENYIYMVLVSQDFWNENNKYDEYIYLNNSLEKVGSWETDLSDYAKLTDLEKFVEKRDGFSLISNQDLTKLAGIEEGAQKNFISSIDSDFTVTNGQLSLNDISISKITNLESILNDKAEKAQINTLDIKINQIESQVNDLTDELNKYVLKSNYTKDMATIMESITWYDLVE